MKPANRSVVHRASICGCAVLVCAAVCTPVLAEWDGAPEMVHYAQATSELTSTSTTPIILPVGSIESPCNEVACDDYCDGQGLCSRDEAWSDGIRAWARFGYMSLDVPVASEDAPNHSIGAAIPLIDQRLYALGSFDAAHDGSSQLLSTFGAIWAPDVWSDSPLNRIGASAVVNNFDDSLFGNADLWRYRLDAYYAFTPSLRAGAFYYAPIGSSNINFTPGAIVPFIENISMSEYGGAFISRDMGFLNLNFRVGYGNRPDSWRVGGGANMLLSEYTSLYFSADAHKEDQWGAVAGVQFFLSSGDLTGRRASGSRDVVRGMAVTYKTIAKIISDDVDSRDRIREWLNLTSGVTEAIINSFTRSP